MNDRTPTEVLANGAIRYGIYDSAGVLLRYEYIKPEDAPTQDGTALNKANLLKDVTAALYGLGTGAVPNDVFALIKPLLDSKAKIATGSYIGTGTYGVSTPNSLTLSFTPKLAFVASNTTFGIFANNFPKALLFRSTTTAFSTDPVVTWSVSSLSWYDAGSPVFQLSESGKTYNYVVLG